MAGFIDLLFDFLKVAGLNQEKCVMWFVEHYVDSILSNCDTRFCIKKSFM